MESPQRGIQDLRKKDTKCVRREKWHQNTRKNHHLENLDFAFSEQFDYITWQLALIVEKCGKIYTVSLPC